MGLIMEFGGSIEGYETVPVPLPPGMSGLWAWGGAVLRRRSARPTRRAVLYLHALDDEFISADQVAWYTGRGFHVYVADLRAVSGEQAGGGYPRVPHPRGAELRERPFGAGLLAADPLPVDPLAADPHAADRLCHDPFRPDLGYPGLNYPGLNYPGPDCPGGFAARPNGLDPRRSGRATDGWFGDDPLASGPLGMDPTVGDPPGPEHPAPGGGADEDLAIGGSATAGQDDGRSGSVGGELNGWDTATFDAITFQRAGWDQAGWDRDAGARDAAGRRDAGRKNAVRDAGRKDAGRKDAAAEGRHRADRARGIRNRGTRSRPGWEAPPESGQPQGGPLAPAGPARADGDRQLSPDISRAAEQLGDCFACLDAAVSHLRGTEAIDTVLVAAHSTGALVAALWAHARRGSRPADALILANPDLGSGPAWLARVRGALAEKGPGRRAWPLLAGARRRIRRGLDIACPVLVLSPAGTGEITGGAAGWLASRFRVAGRAPVRLGAHVTWLSLDVGLPGQPQADTRGRRQFFEELTRWLGAYVSGTIRDQLL